MLTSLRNGSKWIAAAGILALFGQGAPLMAGLLVLPNRPQYVPAPKSQQLSRKELKKMTVAAKTSEQHLRLARYFQAEANGFDAENAAYAAAAARYRSGPAVKNLIAPTAVARYDSIANEFRSQATSARRLAESHRQMAQNAVAQLK